MNIDKPPILLVEDDYVDVLTVKRALRDIKVNNPLVHSENGEEALAYLADQNNPLPSIILLDLNMPKMNGLEFLEVVQHEQRICGVATVVLTTSTEHSEKIKSFRQNIIAYMIKPLDYSGFLEMMNSIKPYLAT